VTARGAFPRPRWLRRPEGGLEPGEEGIADAREVVVAQRDRFAGLEAQDRCRRVELDRGVCHQDAVAVQQ